MVKPNETITAYRQCFITDAGKKVLAHLLIEAGYFDADLKSPEDLAVLNYAKKILHNMGICSTPESVMEYVQKISEMKGI